MTSKYRCETCKFYEDDDGTAGCNIREEWISEDIWRWIRVVGCASHSDIVLGDTVLTELEQWCMPEDNELDRPAKYKGDCIQPSGRLLKKIAKMRNTK